MNAQRLTSDIMWVAALVTGVIDVLLLWIVARVVTRARFTRLKWPSAIVAAVFWLGMWSFAMWGPWWTMAYHHIFPAWAPM